MNIDPSDNRPLYLQIYEQYRDQIMKGVYPAGMKLPPIRRLADDLGVSRNTVETAYSQLSQEGFVASKQGSGYTVENLATIDAVYPQASSEGLSYDMYMRKNRYAPYATNTKKNFTYDFTYGNLEEESFPADTWRKLTSEVLFGTETGSLSTYNDNQGDFWLRLSIANQLQVTRGVQCFPEQIVIQPGTQASIQNLLLLFDPAKDAVAFEDPGYDGVRVVFENCGFKVAPLPILSTDKHAHPKVLEENKPRLIFTTPSNQFPTGKILPIRVRQYMLEWATKNDAYIIEDDYCREFRYKGKSAPSLQSLDQYHRVIYLGTFSKALSPALRMNYLVLPPKLLSKWRDTYKDYYSQVPWLSQAVLRRFGEEGLWDKLVRKAQTRNKKKYERLISALKKYMGDKIDIMESGAGLHMLVGVLDDRNQQTLIAQAAEADVWVYETRKYWLDPDPKYKNYVLIGFSAIKEQDIEPGIEALAKAWFG